MVSLVDHIVNIEWSVTSLLSERMPIGEWLRLLFQISGELENAMSENSADGS